MRRRDDAAEIYAATRRLHAAQQALLEAWARLVTEGGIRDPAARAIREVNTAVADIDADDAAAMTELAEDFWDRVAEMRDTGGC